MAALEERGEEEKGREKGGTSEMMPDSGERYVKAFRTRQNVAFWCRSSHANVGSLVIWGGGGGSGGGPAAAALAAREGECNGGVGCPFAVLGCVLYFVAMLLNRCS